MTEYEKRISSRGILRYFLGLCVRWRTRRRMNKLVCTLRTSGATIGECVALTKGCRIVGGVNLVVGDHCSFQDVEIDSRAPVRIGSYVIVGDRSRIITCSHDIDDPEWRHKRYGIKIDDYVWIASNAIVLPSCQHIGRGAVVGAGSVVAKDVPPMAVMVGNPARILRYRKCVHEYLVVESLLGGDFDAYRASRRQGRLNS